MPIITKELVIKDYLKGCKRYELCERCDLKRHKTFSSQKKFQEKKLSGKSTIISGED